MTIATKIARINALCLPKSDPSHLPEHLLSGMSIFGSLCVLAWLLKFCSYGFDFTDESYYLVWIKNPFIYPASTSQFGFIYHPLFQLLGGSIALLRRANVLVTYALAFFLVFNLLKGNAFGTLSRGQRSAIAAGFAIVSMSAFATWLVTPSYNSLALQALLIGANGLLLIGPRSNGFLGAFLIGTGGWLAFMAKPTTAAALAILSGTYMLLSKARFRVFLLTGLTALALLSASAVAIDGSIGAFIERLNSGLNLAEIMGGGYGIKDILRIDSLHFGSRTLLPIVLISLLAAFAAEAVDTKSKRTYCGLAVATVFFLFTLDVTFEEFDPAFHAKAPQVFFFFSIPLSVLLLGVNAARKHGLSLSSANIALTAVFFILPHAYAFGTNGNYWKVGGAASLFWVLGGVALFPKVARDRAVTLPLLSLGVVAQALTASLLFVSINHPYRQPQPLRQNTYVFPFEGNNELLLPETFGAYMTEAITKASESGFTKSTPVIDLSGQSPGLLFAMHAMNIGQAWTIGGYPGSNPLARKALALAQCEDLARAWILSEPDGPRSLSPDILNDFGASLLNDYKPVGTFSTPIAAGGYKTARLQILLKPTRPADEALDACSKARAGNAQNPSGV